MKNPTVQHYGDWLRQYPWTAWGTLTFARPPTINGILRWVPRLAAHLDETWVGYWWYAVEEGSANGRLHAHMLYGTRQLSFTDREESRLVCRRARKWWEDKLGWAKFVPYDPDKSASYYIAKYVAKELTEWQLGGSWPNILDGAVSGTASNRNRSCA